MAKNSLNNLLKMTKAVLFDEFEEAFRELDETEDITKVRDLMLEAADMLKELERITAEKNIILAFAR